jgi:hypothetical protein
MYYTREYLNRAHREIDTIFRVLFPEHGMAVREEQIMLCHKMLDNLLGRNIALCDAGVGIGKTYAYLVACVLMRKYSLLAEGCSPYEQRPVLFQLKMIRSKRKRHKRTLPLTFWSNFFHALFICPRVFLPRFYLRERTCNAGMRLSKYTGKIYLPIK